MMDFYDCYRNLLFLLLMKEIMFLFPVHVGPQGKHELISLGTGVGAITGRNITAMEEYSLIIVG